MSIADRFALFVAWLRGRVEDEPVAARSVSLAIVGALAHYGIRIDWDLVVPMLTLLGVRLTVSARRKVTPAHKAKGKVVTVNVQADGAAMMKAFREIEKRHGPERGPDGKFKPKG